MIPLRATTILIALLALAGAPASGTTPDAWVTDLAFYGEESVPLVALFADSTQVHYKGAPLEVVFSAKSKEGRQSVAWATSSDGAWSARGTWGGQIRLSEDGKKFDLHELIKDLEPIDAHEENITDLAFSPDAKLLASASGDDTLKIWRTETREELHHLSHENDYDVTGVAFSPDGKQLASCDGDKLVKVWDVESGEEELSFRAHEDAVSAVAFIHGGKTIVSASWDGTIKFHNASNGDERKVLRGHQGAVNALAVSQDRTKILSGGEDKTVRLWDAKTGKLIKTFTGHEQNITCVAISPDGKLAVSGSKGKPRLWKLP